MKAYYKVLNKIGAVGKFLEKNGDKVDAKLKEKLEKIYAQVKAAANTDPIDTGVQIYGAGNFIDWESDPLLQMFFEK